MLQKNADVDCSVHIDFELLDGDSDDIIDLNNALQKLADGYVDALVNSLETKKLKLAVEELKATVMAMMD